MEIYERIEEAFSYESKHGLLRSSRSFLIRANLNSVRDRSGYNNKGVEPLLCSCNHFYHITICV